MSASGSRLAPLKKVRASVKMVRQSRWEEAVRVRPVSRWALRVEALWPTRAPAPCISRRPRVSRLPPSKKASTQTGSNCLPRSCLTHSITWSRLMGACNSGGTRARRTRRPGRRPALPAESGRPAGRRVPGAVVVLVVREGHGLGHADEVRVRVPEDVGADDRVALHHLPLVLRGAAPAS